MLHHSISPSPTSQVIVAGKMVYCGKPSRGCQMCRQRRIKVRGLCLQLYYKLATLTLISAMRAGLHARSVRNQGESVLATKMILILCFVMRHKLPSGELERSAQAKGCNCRRHRSSHHRSSRVVRHHRRIRSQELPQRIARVPEAVRRTRS